MPETIRSLWLGPITNLELLSIASFEANNHPIEVFCYEDLGLGGLQRDANEIMPESEIFTLNSGSARGSLTAFSNIFRYKMLERLGGWWSDLDVICLKPFDFADEYCFSAEYGKAGTIVNGTVMKAPAGSELMRECIRRLDGADRSKLTWDDTGPKFINQVTKYAQVEGRQDPYVFCPCPYLEVDHLFSKWTYPITEESYGVHFWNECLRRKGIDKNGTYPETSVFEVLKKRYVVTSHG